MKPRRIDITLLDDSLKELINASSKIFPLLDVSELPLTKEQEYYRITSGTKRNHVYAWVEESQKYELIGADDRVVDYQIDVVNKPNTFPPSEHTHNEYQPVGDYADKWHMHTESEIVGLDKYTKDEVDSALDTLQQTIRGERAQDLLLKVDKEEGKQLTSNDFTDDDKLKLDSLSENASIDYVTMQEELNTHKTDGTIHVTTLEKAAIGEISGKADKSYVDTELAKKASSSTLSGHTGNSTIHVTQSDKDNWNAKAEASHNHDGIYEFANSNIQSHINSTSNPHVVTKSQVGLGSVSNYGLATQIEAETGTTSSKYMTPLRTKQAIMALSPPPDLSGYATKGELPTKTSDLTNDSGYITADEVPPNGTKVVISVAEPSVNPHDLWYKELS